MTHEQFSEGFRDGLPIAMGYFPVSFTFGMKAIVCGLTAWQAGLISLTNLTSAGQFAGLTIIAVGSSLTEMALTQLVINLRYALMSLSLSQKLSARVTPLQRCIIAYGNTDEIFAVASNKQGSVGLLYMLGLAFGPIIGWVSGTLVGAIAGDVLPLVLQSALGIAIYGMFVAIVVPPMRKSQPVCAVVAIALVISCLCRYTVLVQWITPGFAIILSTVAAAAVGAAMFPLSEEEAAA